MSDPEELWHGFEISVTPGPRPDLYGVAFHPRDRTDLREGRRAGKPPTVFLKVGGGGSIEVIAHLAMESFPGLRQADFERRAMEELRRTVDGGRPGA